MEPPENPVRFSSSRPAPTAWSSFVVSGQKHTSLFTGVIAPGRTSVPDPSSTGSGNGYALMTATLFELAEAGAVVSTEVAVGVRPGWLVSERGAL